jgi:hypothetical protein
LAVPGDEAPLATLSTPSRVSMMTIAFKGFDPVTPLRSSAVAAGLTAPASPGVDGGIWLHSLGSQGRRPKVTPPDGATGVGVLANGYEIATALAVSESEAGVTPPSTWSAKRVRASVAGLLSVAPAVPDIVPAGAIVVAAGESMNVSCSPLGLAYEALSAAVISVTCMGEPSSTAIPSSSPTVTPTSSPGTTTPTSPTDPTSPPTSPTAAPSPTVAPPPGSAPAAPTKVCNIEKSEGNIGCPDSGARSMTGCEFDGASAYCYDRTPNSSGNTTYVNKDCWANPDCQYKLEVNNPGDWQVTANEPAGNTSVRTYPDVQQLTNNWCSTSTPKGFVNCSTPTTDMPINELSALTSTYAESFPDGDGMVAQFAWDIWIPRPGASSQEVMVWVDNHGRPPIETGATFVDTATIAGQTWSLFRYGFGDDFLIWSLGAPDAPAQQASGIVDLLALLNELQARGMVADGGKVTQINAGWEICSTGGADKTFRMTDYSITAVPAG